MPNRSSRLCLILRERVYSPDGYTDECGRFYIRWCRTGSDERYYNAGIGNHCCWTYSNADPTDFTGWNYFKLLLEVVERYIVVGVLCYTSPLAYCMGGSKATEPVFKSWCRMVGSQLLLLVLNVWFCAALTVLLDSLSQTLELLQRDKEISSYGCSVRWHS